MSNCFCHLNGFEVKDAAARKTIEEVSASLNEEKTNRQSGDSTLKARVDSLYSREVIDSTARADIQTTDDKIVNEIAVRSSEVAALTNRVNTLTSLPSGSTTADAELIDIRTGYDGTVYASAGESVREQIKDINESLESLVDIVEETGYFWINRYSKERTAASSKIYISSEYIPVKKGKTYYLTAAGQSGNGYDTSLTVYDTNKTFVSYSSAVYNNTAWIPDIDGYIIISMYNNGKPKCYTKKNVIAENVNKTVAALNNLTIAGKSILWLGTSIPGGTSSNNYPKFVGELLDCTVINKALGTSSARSGVASKVSTADPLGIGGSHYQMATRGLIQTVAEKQLVIDEWSTKWGPNGTHKLYQAPEVLTDEQKEIILNSSYEVRLKPYLDGTNDMPDVFVFDHGWNDSAYSDTVGGAEDLLTVPEDDNRHYFIGAMNQLIKMILKANPKAKIVLIGHYENDRKPHLCEAQEILADMWGFPLCKVWENSGISSKEVLVNGVSTSLINVYCPDGLHPHSDGTTETNRMLARIIAKWLNNVV